VKFTVKFTVCVDDDYVKFVEKLENVEPEVIPTPEVFLEEIEAREKQMKGQQQLQQQQQQQCSSSSSSRVAAAISLFLLSLFFLRFDCCQNNFHCK